MTTAKMGIVRSQRRDESSGGRARSARRSISGPAPDFGAAIRVRLVVADGILHWREPAPGQRGKRNRGGIVGYLSPMLFCCLS